jgi:hypothetical protein
MRSILKRTAVSHPCQLLDDVVIAQRKRITSVTGRITLDTGAVVSFAIGTEELKAAGQNYCIAHNTLPESAAQEDCNVCIPFVHMSEKILFSDADEKYLELYQGE